MPEPDDNTENETPKQENVKEQENDTIKTEIVLDKIDNLQDYEWMVRPCDVYKEELKDCRSIKARLHQYFIYGDILDCSQWKTDYHNCYLWKKYKSDTALEAVIDSERRRRLARLAGHYQNDVWQKRDAPPDDWNAPLPKWLQDKFENSYLKYMSEEMKKPPKEKNPEPQKSSCTIM